MKYIKNLFAALLAVAVALTGAACGTTDPADGNTEGDALVVGYSAYDGTQDAFDGNFSPFFAETNYDYDVVSMTGITLLNSDRAGAVIYHGIEGETIPYRGTDYTYYGPADLEVTEYEDGRVAYDFTLRQDLTFSDGVPVTIDDVIFSLYVLCDPSYDGPSTLCAAPIQGLAEYRRNSIALSALLAQLGENNRDFSLVTEEQQAAFWDAVNQGLVSYAREITDLVLAEHGFDKGSEEMDGEDSMELPLSEVAAEFNIDVSENATIKEFALALGEKFDWNFGALETYFEHTYLAPEITALSGLIPEEVYQYSYHFVPTGESAPNISGIQKTGDYTMRVLSDSVDVELIYQLGSVVIAPMHYYGSEELYDEEKNTFGFPKGDLSAIRAKTDQPMGAGPYQYVQHEGGSIRFEKNPYFYLGAPEIEQVVFRSVPDDWENQNGLLAGDLDISALSSGCCLIDAVRDAGDGQITIASMDDRRYQSIGINPERVNVVGDPGSEASRNLRRAFGTIFSVYRDAAINDYPNWSIGRIESPVSNTFWAVPHPGDENDIEAYSEDVSGRGIYTADMTETQRYEAAYNAALDYFEAAGYTVADGKVTAAPEGASLAFEIQANIIEETNDPVFQILTQAQAALEKMGIKLEIHNVFHLDEYTPVAVGACDMWVNEWNDIDIQDFNWSDIRWLERYHVVDPDLALYQIYFADTANGGGHAGIHNGVYHIADPELDQLILAARSTTDQSTRKALYQDCLDIITDWACEVPIYQEQVYVLFDNDRINSGTIPADVTTSYGWMREVHQIELNG